MRKHAIARAIAGARWNPRDGLIGSDQGLWLDPSDMTTLYRDAGGTLPVTAVEQPVGLMLDKSGRGNHARNSSGNSANFPVLSARYNQYLSTETLATQNVTTVAASYKLAFTGTGSITLSGTATGTYSAGTHTITCTAGPLTSTVSGTVTQADLRVANDALNQPAYQRVNTATDYDTVGFKPYLRFNGVSQWLQTYSIDFSYTDKMFVSAGVRKLTDAYGVVIEASNNALSSPGAFGLISAGWASAGFKYGAALSGSAGAFSLDTAAAYPSPRSDIVTTVSNIAGAIYTDELRIRIDGAKVNGSVSGTSTGISGNFGNHMLYIGARAGTSLWFSGRLYQLVICGRPTAVPADQITRTEAFVNLKTRAF